MSEELIAASKERISGLLEKINGGTGEDISYDEKFDEIKSETEKLSSLSGEECDWSTVLLNAEEILEDKSKDFRVACYWATAKMRTANFEEVLDGFILVEEMINTFWDDMFPPLRRIRARAGMLGWMSDQTGPVLMEIKLKPSDGPMVTLLDNQSKALDAMGREKFGDHYPGISKLREAFRHLIRILPKEKKKPPPKKAAPKKAEQKPAQAAAAAPAPVAAAPPPAAVAGPSAADISSDTEAIRAVGPLGLTLVKIAGLIRSTKPDNELAYRFSRMGMWINLNQAPPVQGGKTLVPAPPPHIRTRLDSLASASDWLTLLNEAENHAGNFILWLDPHRYVATAMGALGPLFMKSKKEMLTQTALMLMRIPTMPKLLFSDGSPLADPQTQMWIENEVVTVLGSGGEGGGGGAPSVLDEPLKEARGLAMKGELGKAIDVVSGAAAGAPTPADRFRGKLAIAQLCLQSGQFEIAKGQIAPLLDMIEEHDLTTWDPNLCAEVYAALYTAQKGLNAAAAKPPPPGTPIVPGAPPPSASPEALAAEKLAFENLCRLDPAQALKLGGAKK